jgi:hypothetical protein
MKKKEIGNNSLLFIYHSDIQFLIVVLIIKVFRTFFGVAYQRFGNPRFSSSEILNKSTFKR